MRYSKLILNGKVVGYRASNGIDRFDVSSSVLEELFPLPYREMKNLTLAPYLGLLVTSDEVKDGKYGEDISNNLARVKDIFKGVKGDSQTVVSATPAKSPKSKVKGTQELEFKKGLSMVLEAVNEANGEYNTISEDYLIHFIFNTKKALEGVATYLGNKFPLKAALNAYGRGKTAFPIRITASELYSLETNFGVKLGVTYSGFTFTSMNHYANYHYSVKLIPPNFDYNITSELADASTGTVADGESLLDYAKGWREALEQGSVLYYPSLSIQQIKRM